MEADGRLRLLEGFTPHWVKQVAAIEIAMLDIATPLS